MHTQRWRWRRSAALDIGPGLPITTDTFVPFFFLCFMAVVESFAQSSQFLISELLKLKHLRYWLKVTCLFRFWGKASHTSTGCLKKEHAGSRSTYSVLNVQATKSVFQDKVTYVLTPKRVENCYDAAINCAFPHEWHECLHRIVRVSRYS